MNKRQEMAAWIVGVGLAAVLFSHSGRGRDWGLGIFAPLVILGTLLFNRLRDADADNGRSLASMGAALLAASMLVAADRVASLGADLDTRGLATAVEEIATAIERHN